MGNLAISSREGTCPLALVAVASHFMKALSKAHLLRLRHECSKLSYRSPNNGERTYYISRACFRQALARTIKDEGDNNKEKTTVVEILDLLFVMFDDDFKDRVNYRSFCCGIAPLACKEGDDLPAVLKFCLKVVDDKDTGMVEPRHVMSVLASISSIASYLGDNVLRPQQVQSIVEDVIPKFGTKEKIISIHECVGRLYQHPLVHDFIEGKRKNVQVSFKLEGNDDTYSDFGSSMMNPYSSGASEDDLLNKFSSLSSTGSDYAVMDNNSTENWLKAIVATAKEDIMTC